MIAEIAEDCMGKELLSKLTKYDKIITIAYDEAKRTSTHQYDPENITHTITLKQFASDALLHELFHAYQYAQCNYNYSPSSANYEIEAQIARFVYMKTHKLSTVKSRIDEFKKTTFGVTTSALYHKLHPNNYWVFNQNTQNVYNRSVQIFINKSRCLGVTLQHTDGFVRDKFNNMNELRINCK